MPSLTRTYPRAIWITDIKFLGGYVGVDALLPLVDQHVRAGGFDSTTFGIGDFFGEGTLSWHIKQFDFAIGSGVWAPTGDSGPPPTTRVGAGFWTFMQTAGATWYIDEAKTWAVSALNRYEFNTEQRDTHVTPGDAYTLEWGISKSVCKEADLGVVGYYQQQVTGNSDKSPLNRVAAIGPEVSVHVPEADVLRLAPLQLRIHGREPRAGQRHHLDPHEAVLSRARKYFQRHMWEGRHGPAQVFSIRLAGGARRSGVMELPIVSRWASLACGSFRKHPMPFLRPGV